MLIFGEIYDEVRLMFVLCVVNHGASLVFVFTKEPSTCLFGVMLVFGVVDDAVSLMLVFGDKHLGGSLMFVVSDVYDAA